MKVLFDTVKILADKLNSISSFKLEKNANISVFLMWFPITWVFFHSRIGLYSNADHVVSPDSSLCPEISWLKVDVALNPG